MEVVMKELNMNKRQLTCCIASFGGVFTGVFAALLPHTQPNEAFHISLALAKTMEADGICQPQCLINTPAEISETADAATIRYISRSGGEYEFQFSTTDWYACKIRYPEGSSLSEFFEKTAKS